MKASQPQLGDPLAIRELDVLRGMARGLTNKEIGAWLYLAEETVKTHARRLFVKLGVSSRVDAIAVGIRRGFVSCPCGAVRTS